MPTLYPAFFFVLEKAAKSAGNAVIPTFPTRWSHDLQHLRRKRPTFTFALESGYTLAFRRKVAHSGSHGETRGVLGEGGIITLGAFRTFTNIPGPGVRTANFAGSGILAGRCSRRTQKAFGTAMRSCASLFRGVAAPPGCVIR